MVFRAGKMKYSKLFFILMLLPYYTAGQNYNHQTFRPSFQLQKQINEKLDIGIEYQNRRQSGTGASAMNIFRHAYQESYRLWLITQFEKDSKQDRKAEFLISPFAYFIKWPLRGKPEDLDELVRREIRFTAMGEVFQYFSAFRIQNRTGYEYRILWNKNTSNILGRVRHRIQAQIKLAGNFRLNLNNEIFIAVPPNANKQQFQENRTGCLVVYRKSFIRIESGYMFLYNQRNTLIEVDQEHGFILNLSIYL
jgi:hypothetical protein